MPPLVNILFFQPNIHRMRIPGQFSLSHDRSSLTKITTHREPMCLLSPRAAHGKNSRDNQSETN